MSAPAAPETLGEYCIGGAWELLRDDNTFKDNQYLLLARSNNSVTMKVTYGGSVSFSQTNSPNATIDLTDDVIQKITRPT